MIQRTPIQNQIAKTRTEEEAKAVLMEALKRGDHAELVGGDYPYDLDLVGFLFPIHNRGVRRDSAIAGELSKAELGALFADAAWALCLEGFLRPGSKTPYDKVTLNSRGFCLTAKGRAYVSAGESSDRSSA